MSRATVVLPLPVAPTSATDSPAGTVRSKPSSTDRQPARRRTHAVEAHLAAAAGRPVAGSGSRSAWSTITGSVARTSCDPLGGRPAARWPWAMIMPSIRSGQISSTT